MKSIKLEVADDHTIGLIAGAINNKVLDLKDSLQRACTGESKDMDMPNITALVTDINNLSQISDSLVYSNLNNAGSLDSLGFTTDTQVQEGSDTYKDNKV